VNALHVLDGVTIQRQLAQGPQLVMATVESAYRIHWERRSVCPESVFLRLPQGNRIVALPAYLNDGALSAAGMKWIASFPGNVANGVDRASAVVVLNDLETGFPTAVLEGASISAARTGALAAIGCRALLRDCFRPKVAVIGCGRIALATLSYLLFVVEPSDIRLFDVVDARAEQFASQPLVQRIGGRKAESLEEALSESDVALFATTSAEPYLEDIRLLGNCKLILHISLRDISEHVLAECFNVTDDRDHVLRERTSLHRLSVLRPDGKSVNAELGDILWNGTELPVNGKVVFSPFGLGVLDVALAKQILATALAERTTTSISDFYATSR
jgi:2,3-diaminopropionate biosynthesis protein SbnB